jgi:hypothetical protein
MALENNWTLSVTDSYLTLRGRPNAKTMFRIRSALLVPEGWSSKGCSGRRVFGD